MDPIILILAFLLSFFLLWFSQNLFIRFNEFDDFNHRSSHKTLATRTGGIGIFVALFVVAIYFYFKQIQIFDYSLLMPLGILFLLGVYDDLYQADFRLKFLMQIIIAKLLIDQGFVFNYLHGFLGIYELPWLAAQMITVLFFVIVVNAYNFIDGIDGLALSESVKNLILFGFILLAPGGLKQLAQLTVFILLPLYYFNFKKNKKVFLGDAGSLFLGGINVVLILYLLNNQNQINANISANRLLLSITIIAYPIVDFLRVILIRISKKQSPFIADQNHIHHWFVKKGFSHAITTLIILGLTSTLALAYILS